MSSSNNDDNMSVDDDDDKTNVKSSSTTEAKKGTSSASTSGGENSLANPEVLNKYKLSADIVNKALLGVISFCKPDAVVSEICIIGDTLVQKQCEVAFKETRMEKGSAFPTCLSVNNCVCHYSPFSSESIKLKAGDIVKIDIGAQIDGYISVVAHTIVVPGLQTPITGRAADVVHAAYTAAEAAVSLIKPGNTNSMITEMLSEVANSFGVSKVQGVLMHQMKRFIIDGNQVIIGKEDVDQKVETFSFEENGVYTIDIILSTGAGKPIQRDARTTVFKRAVDKQHTLKLQASKTVINEINKKFSTFPFTLRKLDEKQARLGITEISKHGLLVPYPVLYEKPKDIVAHFKYTVLVHSAGTEKITGAPLDVEAFVRGAESTPSVSLSSSTTATTTESKPASEATKKGNKKDKKNAKDDNSMEE